MTDESKAAGRTQRGGAINAPISQADERALALWDLWHEQKDRLEHLGRTSCTREKSDAAVDVLVGIENLLQTSIHSSVHALAATLMIEEKNVSFPVPDLFRASLAAIRPQLVGAIAEAADRVLAEDEEGA
jgi:hypothetical protein